jgi:hypothetical protein
MNDKENFAFFAEGVLPLGINLAVIEYTLAPAARLDRIVAEVRCSVKWLAAHLDEYGADPNRLYVAGHSAGGHLTAMAMPLAEVRGGIAISGLFDLEPIRLNYLNEKLGLDTAEAERNRPGAVFAGDGRRGKATGHHVDEILPVSRCLPVFAHRDDRLPIAASAARRRQGRRNLARDGLFAGGKEIRTLGPRAIDQGNAGVNSPASCPSARPSGGH